MTHYCMYTCWLDNCILVQLFTLARKMKTLTSNSGSLVWQNATLTPSVEASFPGDAMCQWVSTFKVILFTLLTAVINALMHYDHLNHHHHHNHNQHFNQHELMGMCTWSWQVILVSTRIRLHTCIPWQTSHHHHQHQHQHQYNHHHHHHRHHHNHLTTIICKAAIFVWHDRL